LKTVAIIPSAGASLRMGTGTAKQFMDLDGRPLLAATLQNFEQCPLVEGIILVVPRDRISYCKEEIVERYRLIKVGQVIRGGKRRQDSVRLGLEAVQRPCKLVLIHDGVRPFAPPEFITRIIIAASGNRAVVPGMPLKETVKQVGPDGRVAGTPDRRNFRLVQTPQAFRYDDILSAHRRAADENWEELTDDALLLERLGIPVIVVEGLEENIKITTPRDLELARFLMRKAKDTSLTKMEIRNPIGF
jgi:2-C-methyl-D-erythritol 4-phosphate cytidylyltransferase